MTSCLYSAGGGELGALGQQLQALAIQQMSSAARTQKHLSVSERSTIPEFDWWQALLESVGLDAPAAGHGVAVR